MLYIRYLDGATVSNEVIDVDLNHYIPAGNEVLIAFDEETYPDRDASNYTRSGNSISYTPPAEPDPQSLPQIDAFYDAVFNDALWTNQPALRPLRPQLATTKSAMKADLGKPLAIQLTWEDLKIAMVAQIGQSAADLIITMVESYAVTYNIPLVA